MTTLPRLALLLLMVVALAACGAPAADETADPTPSQDAGGDGEAPAARHDAPDLEAVLPTEVGGSRMTINSFEGAEAFEEQGFTFEELTGAVDREINDVSVATAVDAQRGRVSIFVMRIEGVQGRQLIDFFVEDQPELGLEPANVAGKSVFVSETGGIYLYAMDELMFQVFGEPQAAQIALSLLPE